MECSICMNSLSEEGDPPSSSSQPPPAKRAKPSASATQLDATPCGHIYHHVCIIGWFASGSNDCPICRKPITKRSLKQVYLPVQSASTSNGEKKCNACEGMKKKLEESENENLALRISLEDETKGKEKALEKVETLDKENEELKKKMEHLEDLKIIEEDLKSVVEPEVEIVDEDMVKDGDDDDQLENDPEESDKDKIDRLLNENKKLRMERGTLKDKLKKLDSERNCLEEDILGVLEEYRELQGKLKQGEAAEKKLKELEEKHKKIINDLDQLTVTNLQDKERIKDLERSVASLETFLADTLNNQQQDDS